LAGQLDGLVGQIHTDHLLENRTAVVECEDCHKVPEQAWAQGHLFDQTPGVAEVTFGPNNPEGRYEGAGLCSSLRCHGDGRTVGNVAFQEGRAFDCQSCHPRQRLSGEHGEHLGEGVDCEDCHGEVVLGRDEIKDFSLHIDDEIHLAFPSGFTYQDDRCSGRCHGEGHNNERW
jgi:predicted CxxxxCH...CXXCH cytochrome family protein